MFFQSRNYSLEKRVISILLNSYITPSIYINSNVEKSLKNILSKKENKKHFSSLNQNNFKENKEINETNENNYKYDETGKEIKENFLIHSTNNFKSQKIINVLSFSEFVKDEWNKQQLSHTYHTTTIQNDELNQLNETNQDGNNILIWSKKDRAHFLKQCIRNWNHDISARRESNLISNILDLSNDYIERLIGRTLLEKRTSNITNPATQHTQLDLNRDAMITNSNSNMHAKTISIEHINSILTKWLQENNNQPPNRLSRIELRKATGLNAIQLSRRIQMLLDHKSPITYESRKIILQWCEKNQGRKPTEDEKIYLQNITNLGRAQLHNLISYYQQVKGKITLEKRMNIHKKIELDFNGISNFSPTSTNTELPRIPAEYINDLTIQFKLSPIQVRGIIGSYFEKKRANEITDSKREHILQWLQKNDYQSPTQEQRKQLIQSTQMTSKQLSKIIQRLKYEHSNLNHDLYGLIPNSIKDILISWLIDHEYRSPTTFERDQLQSQTGLSRLQLNDQISYLRSGRGTFTFKRKQYILAQLNKLNERLQEELKEENKENINLKQKLSEEQLKQLSKETNLSIRQIREFIQRSQK